MHLRRESYAIQDLLCDLSCHHSLENLLMRYEEPSSMVRWDSPLFTVPWTDDDVPIDDIWKAITEGNLKPPNAGTQAVNADSSITLDIESHN